MSVAAPEQGSKDEADTVPKRRLALNNIDRGVVPRDVDFLVVASLSRIYRTYYDG